MNILRQRARDLRNNATDAERLLWRHLRLWQIGGYKFRRQQPLGCYIVDFVCLEKRVIIELDGGQHSEHAADDRERDTWLRHQGFVVLRFWNDEVLKNCEAVREVILNTLLNTPHLSPPPQGGRSSEKERAKARAGDLITTPSGESK